MNSQQPEEQRRIVEQWPNRRIIYLAAVITIIVFLIFHLPVAVSTLFSVARDTIIVLILAIGLTYLLAPLHDLLMRIGWPGDKDTRRRVYGIVTIVVFVAVTAGLLALIVNPLAEQTGQALSAVSDWFAEDFSGSVDNAVNTIVEAAPEQYQAELRSRISELMSSFEGDGLSRLIQRWGGALLEAQVRVLQAILSSGAYLLGLLIVPIFAYYFLTDHDAIRRGLASHVPEEGRPRFHRALNEINEILLGYVRAMVVVAVVTSLATGLLLYFGGVPAYLALGVLTGIGEMIPVLGPIVAFVAMLGIALLTVSLDRVFVIMLIYGAINFGADRLLSPKLMAEGVGLHPAAIIIVLMLGGQFFGIIGIFVAVPITAALRLAYIHTRAYFVDEHHRADLDEIAGPKDADEE